MSSWILGSRLTYREYLQAESFETGLTSAISSATRQIVCSVDEAREANIEVVHELAREVGTAIADLSAEVEQVRVSLGNVERAIDRLTFEFHWGVSEVLASLGRMNESVSELIRLTSNPEHTWALEQFATAKVALGYGLHEQALACVDRAINGFGDHTGYPLDYRFHQLRGAVLIGSYRNHSVTTVDASAAEAAFVMSSRLALREAPIEAADALVAAGWAAYTQGGVSRAIEHTESALALQPLSSEGLFQLSKLQIYEGRFKLAEAAIRSACNSDCRYALKAATDVHFQRHLPFLNAILESLRDEARNEATEASLRAESAIERAEAKSASVGVKRTERRARLARAKERLDRGRASLAVGTYWGAIAAASEFDSAEAQAIELAPGPLESRLAKEWTGRKRRP